MILLDTSVLSLALRRGRASAASATIRGDLERMILEDAPLALPGIVFQEVLSGVKDERQFEQLRRELEGLPIVLAATGDHLRAAALFNACQRHGIAGTLADCLIAALAIERDAQLWSLDTDFERIARHCDLQLFQT